ncbi:MAG TPA: bifunctional riboflavin kinase/FAD synthetase [Rhodocyclaceae bacterium]|nr:MAG: riboflavin biosynthesis protein RibF [Betaproteobacteria bacterium CG2_30_68_42]PIV71683.1 MAG: bifunctional riboflavin kinase/FAD synthetase [Rhodocyclales bacterium CG17_big_fil_post_rev_8_21_14_2_50_68_7]PIX74978.1 MAG: bifunctional riboflavin kinase/FAD synthetase [Rhodocyclales bacterium CG_4_10_14_3_um_filter_68_10]PJA57763.1 MAG: bifunctional riboflavin kinase/FAD synthetase [Rhodocyclales bacterium CG_4_9_14_3_um_filter_68_10]HCX34357.1 bifunctional riboflavin kinase/FAD synthet
MLVFRGIPESAHTPCVLTIGNFDGVHRGHQVLLSLLAAHAGNLGIPGTVMTFEPHPREYFSPTSAPARLTSLREKLALLEANGVERVHVCRFDERMAHLTAERFIDRILVHGLATRHLIVGDDFRFGKGRSGDFALLRLAGAERGFAVEAMQTVEIDGERVSSSAIRRALQHGDLDHAARLLGRNYAIAGRVLHGDARGRSIGFPTANIQLRRNRLPMTGVFAVEVSGIGRALRPGVANLGVRPTVDSTARPSLEVHLLDFEADLYCAHLSVGFLRKLREQAKFDSLAALSAQIGRDVEAARAFFAERAISAACAAAPV